MEKLIERMMKGDQYALSRLIKLIESDAPETPMFMKMISLHPGNAYVVGITGLPGSGKSTLISGLTSIARDKDLHVGIIAVDPTSPFTGGALLGDRIRMRGHTLDPCVFVRSMASRDSHGGLPLTVRSVARLLSAFGKDIIFEETVGVGQTELDINKVADTVVVILFPEAGDITQAIKAGLMEIAHIFVINKADRDGADKLKGELLSAQSLRQRSKQHWEPPIILTQGLRNIGTEEVYKNIERHKEYIEINGAFLHKRRYQRREELLDMMEQRFLKRLRQLVNNNEELISLIDEAEKGQIDVYMATDVLERRLLDILRLSQEPIDKLC